MARNFRFGVITKNSVVPGVGRGMVQKEEVIVRKHLVHVPIVGTAFGVLRNPPINPIGVFI